MPTPKKILVVDDDAGLTKTIALFFQDTGYQVQTANSGLEANKAIRSAYFDLILLDLNMPDFNGINVAKICREHRPNTKIMVVTGYKAQYESELHFVGPECVMQKPIAVKELKANVTALLGETPVIQPPKSANGMPYTKVLFVEHDDLAYIHLFVPYFKTMNEEKKANYELSFADDRDKAVTLARLFRPGIALINTDVVSDIPEIQTDIQIAQDIPREIIIHGRELYAKSPEELGLDRNKVTAVEGGLYDWDYPRRLEQTVRAAALRHGLTQPQSLNL